MSRRARWSIYASFFGIFLAACGGDDDNASGSNPVGEPPTMSCTTLKDLPCSCPGGNYGVYACDGTCLMCPPPGGAAGSAPSGSSTGAAGSTATGQAGRMGMGFGGRGGGAGRGMAPMSPVNPGGMAGSPAFPGTGGMMSMPGAAGMSAMPAAGSGAPAAGSGATTTGDVPSSAVCMPVSSWPAEAAMFEQEVLRLVNENRAKGWNCDTMGQKPAVGPLAMEPTLRCSARLHSKDMADKKYFAHDAPDGRDPGARMTAAGYMGRTWGENIAKGQSTPAQVVQGWMDSDGHCANIMNGGFNLIGVGYFAGMATSTRFNSELYWTQNFGATSGAPRR